ncbi:MAG: hypothetical protein GYB18_14440 [Oceanospirillales bacterium]|nr:hypothetical protein [Oceanospirillales bacterium]
MQADLDFDDRWLDELIAWADKYDLPHLHCAEPETDDDGNVLDEGCLIGIPRDKEQLRNLEVLNLTGYVKSDIPDQIRYLTNLRELYFPGGLDAWWAAEEVDRDKNAITEIPEWIADLKHLEVLDLSDNYISYVPGSLARLPNLKRLYLNNNRIDYVSSELQQLTSLETLWMQGPSQTSLIPEGLMASESLKELWLDGLPGSEYGPVSLKDGGIQVCTRNGYSVIPLDPLRPRNFCEALDCLDQFVKSPWIDELYQWADDHSIPDLQFVHDDTRADNGEFLFERFWVGLPRDRYALLGLEELDLSWHSCSGIPDQIRYLKKLKKLSFAKRKDGLGPHFYENCMGPESIEVIPDWLGELEALEELDLSGNRIVDIPNSIANLKHLKRLDLSSNHIIYVPAAVGDLSSLRKLYLDSNRIIFVEPELGMLPNLEVLWIRKNKFSIIDECIADQKIIAPVEIYIDVNQTNKIFVLMSCIDQLGKMSLDDDCFVDLDDKFEGRLRLFSKGFYMVRDLVDSRDKDLMWNTWSKLSDIKSIVEALPELKELWCDGLERSQYGPVKLCDGG